MPEVRFVPVAARPFAGVRRVVRRTDVPRELIAGLDLVWSVIRRRGLDHRGHNVAVYRDLGDGTVEMECGVEVAPGFAPDDEVALRQTPAGTAATATHRGPVGNLGETYRLVFRALDERGTAAARVVWEVYGDASPETGAFDTDVFVLVEPDGPDAVSPGSIT